MQAADDPDDMAYISVQDLIVSKAYVLLIHLGNSQLQSNTTYEFSIPKGVVADLMGNSFRGFEGHDYSFVWPGDRYSLGESGDEDEENDNADDVNADTRTSILIISAFSGVVLVVGAYLLYKYIGRRMQGKRIYAPPRPLTAKERWDKLKSHPTLGVGRGKGKTSTTKTSPEERAAAAFMHQGLRGGGRRASSNLDDLHSDLPKPSSSPSRRHSMPASTGSTTPDASAANGTSKSTPRTFQRSSSMPTDTGSDKPQFTRSSSFFSSKEKASSSAKQENEKKEKDANANAKPKTGEARRSGKAIDAKVRTFMHQPTAEAAIEVCKKLEERMRAGATETLDQRKKMIHGLMLQYHPDKNQEPWAAEVFRFVNGNKEWFLRDD